MGNTMNKKSLFSALAIFVGVSLTLFAGGPRQVHAAPLSLEFTGTVEKKERSAELPPSAYVEPGNSSIRADRATAIIVDGSRMFIIPETVIKKFEASAKKNDALILNFDEVAVPCQARIVYQQLPNGNRNVLEMHILSESAGASKKWGAPAPQ